MPHVSVVKEVGFIRSLVPPRRVEAHYNWKDTPKKRDHMHRRQKTLYGQSLKNDAENEIAEYLIGERLKWFRQSSLGGWVFDFWCPLYGLVVEVDGLSHQTKEQRRKDRLKDEFLMFKHGIVVLRVKNHVAVDVKDLLHLLDMNTETWKQRRNRLKRMSGFEHIVKAEVHILERSEVAMPKPNKPDSRVFVSDAEWVDENAFDWIKGAKPAIHGPLVQCVVRYLSTPVAARRSA